MTDLETYRTHRGMCLTPSRHRSAEQTPPIAPARLARDGLADQTVVKDLEDIRSYRAVERTLIGGIDPRSVIDLGRGKRLKGPDNHSIATSVGAHSRFARSGRAHHFAPDGDVFNVESPKNSSRPQAWGLFRNYYPSILPGEDPTAFQKLHRELIVELLPNGLLEHNIVATIARLVWRKHNLATFRLAELVREHRNAIRSKRIAAVDKRYRRDPFPPPIKELVPRLLEQSKVDELGS
jgi:hypothetical protein